MKKKHRELRDWVWIALAALIFVLAIFGGGALEAWLR